MLVFPVVLAALWCAFAFELVLESARVQARALVVFGDVLAAPSVTATIVVLCLVSASAAIAMVSVLAHARGRRLERRMVAELDARWAALAERDAGDAARKNLLSWRLAELQTLVEQLLAEREATLRHKPQLFLVPESVSVTRAKRKAAPASPH
ncbi:MAG: hypothetical protein ABJB55_04730 [Actinomycetota bacterium]